MSDYRPNVENMQITATLKNMVGTKTFTKLLPLSEKDEPLYFNFTKYRLVSKYYPKHNLLLQMDNIS